MIKIIHIKFLLLFSLSILFGHSVFGQASIGDQVPIEQHVCVGAEGHYTVFGFPGSTIKWYIQGSYLSGKDVVVPNNASNVPHNGFDYNTGSLNYTWDGLTYPAGAFYMLQIEEVSKVPAACPTGLVSPGLKIYVHAIPSILSVTINQIACNGQQGGLGVNLSGITIPTGLVLQARLVNQSDNSVVTGHDWADVTDPTSLFNFAGLNAGSYKVQIRYMVGGEYVKGSLVSSNLSYVLTNPSALALSKSTTNVTCAGGADGAVDLTVSGGENKALDFNGTSGGIVIGSSKPLYNVSEFTVEGWVKLKSGNNYPSGQYSLFGQNNTIEFGIDGGNLQGWVQTTNGNTYSLSYPIAGNLNDGQFHHLAFSGNRNNLILYVDGLAVGNRSILIAASNYFGGSPRDLLRIGTGVFDGGVNDPFDGEISHVRFWSVARTQSQILAGMSQLMAGSETGLLGAYALGEGSGTIVSGVGSFAENGTLASDLSWTSTAALYSYLWTKQGDASFTATSQDLADLSAGTYQVTVSNANGCTISDNNIVVGVQSDNTPPVPDVAILLDVKAECEVISLTAPTATDNCSGSLIGTHDATLPITGEGTTTAVTWTYDDGNGNTTTQVQNVIIDDITPPVITACPSDIQECSTNELIQEVIVLNIGLSAANYSDNCGGVLTVQYQIKKADNTILINFGDDPDGDASNYSFPEGINTVTYRVTDLAGLSSECSFTVTISHKPVPSNITF